MQQYDWTSKWALYRPDETAFWEWGTDRKLSWARLDSWAHQWAAELQDRYQIKHGDRVAILSENNLEYIALFAAALKLGYVMVPLNYRLSPSEMEYILRDSEPSLFIYDEDWQELAGKALALYSDIQVITLTELKAHAQNGEDVKVESARVDDDDPVFILYTSGTTGFPKGAMYTYKMMFWNSINTAMSLIINQDGKTINVMPPFHTGGWNVLTTPLYHHGGMTCLMKRFDAAEVLKAIDVVRPTIFMAVPTMLQAMADEAAFSQVDLSCLYYMIVGGESMPIPLIETYHSKGIMIRQGYGMTEVGPNLTSLHQSDAIRKKGSIGRPNFYVDIRIVDENGAPCPPNVPGELLLRGPMVTPGYWRNEKATLATIEDGWFRTGDSVYQDEENYIYIHDRIKNMFISGAENVYPAEVERVLRQHPNIAEVIVIGVPDEKWGEVGKAYYTGPETLDPQDMKDFCDRHLARYKIPKYWVHVDEIPQNSAGKIDRKGIRESGIAGL